MPSGAFKLGELLGGGGASSEMAQIAGEKARADMEHLSAQTQAALEKAKSEQLAARKAKREMDADDDFASGLVTMGVAKDLNEGLAMAGAARAGYADLSKLATVRGDLRKQGYGDTLADELAPPEKRLAASSALKNEVQSPFQQVPGEYVDVTKPSQGVQVSPNVQSQIDERKNRPKIVQVGGVPYDSATGKPFVPVSEVAGNVGALTGARTTATVQGKNAVALPGVKESIDEMRVSIRNLLGSPGFASIYGISSKLDPSQLLPGSDYSNAKILRDKIDAQAFGVAVQKMRGLGQLSNAEGLKVQNAFTTATQPGLSDEQAELAWNALLVRLDRLERVAQQEAGAGAAPGGAAAPSAKPKTIKQGGYTYTLNEATGEYE